MEKALFFSDIDNTLIYSKKHPHEGWPCVEWIHEVEQAYMSPFTIEALRQINLRGAFIPVTSRSIEQYNRVCFPDGCLPKYAITTNGAKLLVDGVPDEAWSKESERLIEPYRAELERQFSILSPMDCFIRCRMVDDAYLFVYVNKETDPITTAKSIAKDTTLAVFASGKKIYLMPPDIHKGTAVKRLAKMIDCQKVLCAGDSDMDLPMLRVADVAIIPRLL